VVVHVYVGPPPSREHVERGAPRDCQVVDVCGTGRGTDSTSRAVQPWHRAVRGKGVTTSAAVWRARRDEPRCRRFRTPNRPHKELLLTFGSDVEAVDEVGVCVGDADGVVPVLRKGASACVFVSGMGKGRPALESHTALLCLARNASAGWDACGAAQPCRFVARSPNPRTYARQQPNLWPLHNRTAAPPPPPPLLQLAPPLHPPPPPHTHPTSTHTHTHLCIPELSVHPAPPRDAHRDAAEGGMVRPAREDGVVGV
jgi:hypothetical protein